MPSRAAGGALVVLLTALIQKTLAQTCVSEDSVWHCSCGCCYDYYHCCVSCASYWYAWLLLTLFFLVCLCACLGCGSYGYRRYYVVRRTPVPTAYTVTPSAYQPAPASYQQYKSYDPSQAPPPYNPSQAPPPYRPY